MVSPPGALQLTGYVSAGNLRCRSHTDSDQIPHEKPPVPQPAEGPALVALLLDLGFEAQADILRVTWSLPHSGQITSSISEALKTNSSKSLSQLEQVNS